MTAHRPRLHRDPPTSPPTVDYRQMADDYGGISSIAFNAKYGADWYERHHEALEAEFRRRHDPDPLTVELEQLERNVDRLATEADELASSWRSCLLWLAAGALLLILVGLAAGQLGGTG